MNSSARPWIDRQLCPQLRLTLLQGLNGWELAVAGSAGPRPLYTLLSSPSVCQGQVRVLRGQTGSLMNAVCHSVVTAIQGVCLPANATLPWGKRKPVRPGRNCAEQCLSPWRKRAPPHENLGELQSWSSTRPIVRTPWRWAPGNLHFQYVP